MSDKEKDKKIRVTDKRKFDAEGNPRKVAEEQDADDATGSGEEASAAANAEEAQANARSAYESSRTGQQAQKIDFATFILSLGTQAMMSMGLVGEPGQKPQVNLQAAQQLIDILAMLREKTRGNLEAFEITTIDNLLFDLRMGYVEVSKKQDQEPKES